jgi:SAM-dependent methyltransferase
VSNRDSLYDQPAFYDLLFGGRRGDLPFYLELAAEAAGPILELGIGSGRVGLALARAGHEVVGVERSGKMLLQLEARVEAEPIEVRRRIRWLQGDSRELELGRRFGLVICPFNGMAHFPEPSDVRSVLRVVSAHLDPEGAFAFDLLLPTPELLEDQSSFVPWFRDPRTGEVSRYEERIEHDPVSRILSVAAVVRSMEVDREPLELSLRLRLFSPEEITGHLERQGFQVVRLAPELGDVIGLVCRRGRQENSALPS